MNRAFVNCITDLLIDDLLVVPFTSLCELLPSQFWTAPASSSGLHHPSYALGSGGLVRHSLVCVHVARDLCQPYGITDEITLDAVTIAAALHDGCKGGRFEAIWERTVPAHPEQMADLIFDYVSDCTEAGFRSTGQNIALIRASFMIEGHMSQWGLTPKTIGSGLNAPESLVATADYMASRKYFEPSGKLAEILLDF